MEMNLQSTKGRKISFQCGFFEIKGSLVSLEEKNVKFESANMPVLLSI